jgi:hypothetical protein
VAMSVREAVERADVDAFVALLREDAVWVGLLPGQLCRDREQVAEMIRRGDARAERARPRVGAEIGAVLVVDPALEPPAELAPELHQVLVLDERGRVREIRNYPDGASAFAAAEKASELLP